MTEEQYDVTICTISPCFAFKIPPRSSSGGYRAADWSNDQIWAGKLRIVERNEEAVILLENVDKEGLFAACLIQSDPAKPTSVEPVADSSRYFVLRLEDGKGNHIFIGIGFNSRDHSFEFKVAMRDFQRQLKDRKQSALQSEVELKGPQTDYSLKGKITLGSSFGPSSSLSSTRNAPKDEMKNDLSFDLGIAPPPTGGSRKTTKKTSKPSSNSDWFQFESL